ncbi:MAG: 16S rRNA processing protein RimM [Desulfovibrionaceae bacterium]|jgi:16S rRNA processing protein RimM|nr:16S rRNA processing protein RimM [Desulfovibrionaceae bacterium]
MAERSYTRIGRVTKPHGIKGEVCVDYYADSPFLLTECPSLRLSDGRSATPVRVADWRMHQGRPLVRFAHCKDRNKAEELRGLYLEVKRSELPEPDDDEIYVDDLEGLDVYLPDGSRLGSIESVHANDYQEVWTIRTDKGQEVLFPATEDFVASADLDAGRIDITPPEGLLDLYLTEPEPDQPA